MCGLDDLDVFDVLYVLDDLDFLDFFFTNCALDRFTKRFLSDIDGSRPFLMEVYLA